MTGADLNLLKALDALLAEGSVAGAARRLGLSASAMSRTLARLRRVTGDPLLVRAGQGMTLTPRAAALRERVPHLVGEVDALLAPAEAELDLAALRRTFTIRANEAFVVAHGARLAQAIWREAPGVQLRFAPQADKKPRPLREGLVDLDIGVLVDTAPELKVQVLFRDRFVGAVRAGHPLTAGELTARRYAEAGHVITTMHGGPDGPAERALADLGLTRRRVLMTPSFPAAVAVAAASDLVALAPRSFVEAEQARTANAGVPTLVWFELPIPTRPIAVSLIWHPRFDADLAHRWLRSVIRAHCGGAAEMGEPVRLAAGG